MGNVNGGMRCVGKVCESIFVISKIEWKYS